MFLATVVIGQVYQVDLGDYLGLHFVLSPQFNAAQLISYMFMHGGFAHLFFNMFAVWMFGRVLERVWGPRRFLFYYLVCGIGAGLIQEAVTAISYFQAASGLPADVIGLVRAEGLGVLKSGQNYADSSLGALNLVLNSSTVGASGAVYAILLGFGMLYPNSQMYVFPLPVPIKAKFFVAGYAVIELFSGLSNNPHDNVAHFAHLGGMIFGLILILYWRRKERNNNGYYTY